MVGADSRGHLVGGKNGGKNEEGQCVRARQRRTDFICCDRIKSSSQDAASRPAEGPTKKRTIAGHYVLKVGYA